MESAACATPPYKAKHAVKPVMDIKLAVVHARTKPPIESDHTNPVPFHRARQRRPTLRRIVSHGRYENRIIETVSVYCRFAAMRVNLDNIRHM